MGLYRKIIDKKMYSMLMMFNNMVGSPGSSTTS